MGEAEYGIEGEIDYALVDFLGAHLKPTIYMLSTDCEFREDYAMLFTHGVLRDYVKHLVYKFDKIPAPDCIFAELLGVDVVKRCDIATEVDPRPWINKFIEEADVPVDLGPFGQPWRADVPRPNCEFIQEWLRERRSNMLRPTDSPVGELFLFDNTTSSKKLELFAWTIKERTVYDSLHYAFLLRVVDM